MCGGGGDGRFLVVYLPKSSPSVDISIPSSVAICTQCVTAATNKTDSISWHEDDKTRSHLGHLSQLPHNKLLSVFSSPDNDTVLKFWSAQTQEKLSPSIERQPVHWKTNGRVSPVSSLSSSVVSSVEFAAILFYSRDATGSPNLDFFWLFY